jgi:hypothetical protein
MMRYQSRSPFPEIEATIREALAAYSLTAVFARDLLVHGGLWENVCACMNSCHYGLAVFERLHEPEFNPNVACETRPSVGETG